VQARSIFRQLSMIDERQLAAATRDAAQAAQIVVRLEGRNDMFLAPQLVDLANQQSALSQSPLAAYFSSMSAVSSTMTPVRGVARAGAEAVGYMSRRTVATLDSVNRISRCRTPKDLIDEQTRFWNTAMQQYMEASQRIMAAWGQASVLPVTSSPVEIVTLDTDRRAKSRDVIMLSEPKQRAVVYPMASDREREAA
jgi:hypothetical protein